MAVLVRLPFIVCAVFGVTTLQFALSKHFQGENKDELAALHFLDQYNNEASQMCKTLMQAQWNFNSNVSMESKKIMLDRQLDFARFQKEAWLMATSFAWQNFSRREIRRQFHSLSLLGRAALSNDSLREIQTLLADMRDTYGNTRLCPYKSQSPCDLALEPEISRLMAESQKPSELLYLWKNWHEKAGRPLKSKFERYVQLSNEAARLNGFEDQGAYWRSSYDLKDFEDQLESLWQTIKPLYQQLHAYVRRQLRERYGTITVPRNGPIPAHLLGNMWGQSWSSLYSWTLPFPKNQNVNITEEMLLRSFTPEKMFRKADEFYTSLGFKPVHAAFWEKSILEKPTVREAVCQPSAWDFCDGEDFRIKQCTEVSEHDLLSTYHEMAHIRYYMEYAHLPFAFREGANPAFHEALGDAMTLSIYSPSFLKRLQLPSRDNPEIQINQLYAMALEKLAFAPFGYLVDKWRWQVFRGEIPPTDYNAAWWQMRQHYQGVAPPLPRSEADFDAGAKYNVAANSPYIRFFVSFILQFQIHQALCEAAGHYGPLHLCDLYGSKEAGERLSSVLKLGSSVPASEIIRLLTNGKTNRMDSSVILVYFEPLAKWLEEKNKDEVVGWDMDAQYASRSSGIQRQASVSIIMAIAIIGCPLQTTARLYP